MPRVKDRVKIIATLGPATSNLGEIKKLIQAGADVFRLNFSHGTHTDHQANLKNIRLVAKELATEIEDSMFIPFQKQSDNKEITIGIGMPTKSTDGIKISMLIFIHRKNNTILFLINNKNLLG